MSWILPDKSILSGLKGKRRTIAEPWEGRRAQQGETRHQRWYRKQPEASRAYYRRYYLANKEKMRAASKTWKDKNRERLRQYDRDRYARVNGHHGS